MRILEVKYTIINTESKRKNLIGWTQLKRPLKNGRIGHWKAHKLKGEKMLENPKKNIGHLHSVIKKFYFTCNWSSEAEWRKHGAEATFEIPPLLNSHS